jgi:hypothetical protein
MGKQLKDSATQQESNATNNITEAQRIHATQGETDETGKQPKGNAARRDGNLTREQPNGNATTTRPNGNTTMTQD